MKDSKYIFDSWFDELFWDFVCKEQENHDKAAYLAISFFSPGGRLPIREKMGFFANQINFLISYLPN